MKKKTIKINFKYFGPGFNPEDNFFTNTLRKFYNINISDKPDYLFYSIYPEQKNNSTDLANKGDSIKKISPRLYVFLRRIYSKVNLFLFQKKPLVPKGDFVKIFCGSEHTKPNMKECDWAFSTYFEDQINHPNYMRIPIMFTNDFQLKDFGIPPIKNKIDFNKIKKEKIKFCNFIYSQEITQRNNFFKLLSKYKMIDAPGRCMTNMSPIKGKSAKQSRLSYNWVLDKLNFLKSYKFTIAFENAPLSGWVTEKLTHPMLVNSIPIYIGHEDVSKDFNTKSFINYHDFKNMKEFIEFIIKVDNDDELYKKILNEPWYVNNKLSNDLILSRIEKRLKDIFN